jgi:hypothetical protein
LEIVLHALVNTELLEKGIAPAEQERELAMAHEALKRRPLSLATVRWNVLKALEVAVGPSEWSEKTRTDHAFRSIAMAMNQARVPLEFRGKTPSLPIVLACVRAWRRPPGAPRKGSEIVSKVDALLELFRELGIASGGERGIEKLLKATSAKRERLRALMNRR